MNKGRKEENSNNNNNNRKISNDYDYEYADGSGNEKKKEEEEEEVPSARGSAGSDDGGGGGNSLGLIVGQVYREYASESTIHGIKYTIKAKTPMEKALWLLIVFISLLAAIGLAHKFYERHETGNMRTTVVTNQYPALKIPLPAVTICSNDLVANERVEAFYAPENRLLMPDNLTMDDFVDGLRYLRQIVYPTNHYMEQLNKLQRILDLNNLTIIQLLELVSPRCDDMLLVCAYEGLVESCEKLFETTITSYGICCSFNDASRRKKGTPFNRDQFSINFGPRHILSVLLRSYSENETYADITYGDGYKLMLHERYTLPGPNSLEIMAGNGLETVVNLRGNFLTCSPEILDLPPAKRMCKQSTKEELYRAENCYVQCRYETMQSRCGCLPFSASQATANQVLCDLTSIPCLARIDSEICSLRPNDPQCNCMPDCERVKYTMTISAEPLDALEYKPGKFYKRAQEYPDSMALHITFAGQGATHERKELVLSWINLVSSLGGVFSLFLGCSFISIIEIIYFFIQLLRKLLSR